MTRVFVATVVLAATFGSMLLAISTQLPTNLHLHEQHDRADRIISSLENLTVDSLLANNDWQQINDVYFDCSNISLLRFSSADRAMWSTTTVFTIRRPPNRSNWTRAVEELRREYEKFQLFSTFHVATTFGGCFDDTNRSNVFFVQQHYPSYELQDLLLVQRQQLPWCVRSRVAIGLLTLANQLSRPNRDATHAVFCDWSLSNFVVLKKDYRVVCVDLSSLHLLPVLNGSALALNENQPCKHKPKTHCHALNQCWLGTDLGVNVRRKDDDNDHIDHDNTLDSKISVAPDGKCDSQTHRCPGFDRKSHGAKCFSVSVSIFLFLVSKK